MQETEFATISEIADGMGGVEMLYDFIRKRVALYQESCTPQEYLDHIILDRDVIIKGHRLKEYDRFLEGYYYAKGGNTSDDEND